jgi:VWFA-related protein
MFSSSLRSGVVFLALFFVCGELLIAQSDPPPSQAQASPAPQPTQPQKAGVDQTPTVTIRETVRRVIVDVMVRDASGKPVHGLKADDFSVLEDKAPQRILSFDVYDFDKPSISRGPNASPLPPNVFVNVPDTPERGPLYVILYDLVNTETEDQMTSRQAILKFINSKPEGTRFAIFVNSDELALAQGFTADKDLLYAALDGKHSRAHVPRVFLYARNYGRGDPYALVQVLTYISSYLDGIPGRKNLIWVAGNFPVDVFPNSGDPVNWQDQIKAEINALAQAEVAVFPLNVRGVVVSPEGALTGAMPHGGAGGESVGLAPGTVAPNAMNNPGTSPVSTGSVAGMQGSGSLSRQYATQDVIATMTGGRAFYSDNDLKTVLTDATEDGGNYYTLTYAPPSQSDDGKCHNIGVKLDKTGYELAFRRTYCFVPMVSSVAEGSANAGAAALAIPLQAGDLLQANMKQGAPMVHDLVFSAHLRKEGNAAMATPAQMIELQEQANFFLKHRKSQLPKPLPPTKVQMYAIDYRVLDPQLKAQAERSGGDATLEFAVAAYDAEGHVLNGIINDGAAESSSDAGDNKTGLYRVRQTLVVPVSAVTIRVGVRDRISDRLGTLEVPLPLAPEPVANATPIHSESLPPLPKRPPFHDALAFADGHELIGSDSRVRFARAVGPMDFNIRGPVDT